jgi:hypothetical protein
MKVNCLFGYFFPDGTYISVRYKGPNNTERLIRVTGCDLWSLAQRGEQTQKYLAVEAEEICS